MNGVHDMGGMDGFGKVEAEKKQAQELEEAKQKAAAERQREVEKAQKEAAEAKAIKDAAKLPPPRCPLFRVMTKRRACSARRPRIPNGHHQSASAFFIHQIAVDAPYFVGPGRSRQRHDRQEPTRGEAARDEKYHDRGGCELPVALPRRTRTAKDGTRASCQYEQGKEVHGNHLDAPAFGDQMCGSYERRQRRGRHHPATPPCRWDQPGQQYRRK